MVVTYARRALENKEVSTLATFQKILKLSIFQRIPIETVKVGNFMHSVSVVVSVTIAKFKTKKEKKKVN